MKKKKAFKRLLNRYTSGQCSEDELKELLNLLEEEPQFYDLLDQQVKEDWQADTPVKDANKKHQNTKLMWLRLHFRTIGSVAAGLVLLVIAGIWWWTADPGVVVYATGYGERQQIELPDGSMVELNANTELTWNRNWKRTGIREVTLNGEAFFEVVKSRAKQFRVHSEDVTVNVLGTSFNVSSRRGKTEVFLEEGKVKLDLPEESDVAMEPGERIRFDRAEKKMEKTVNETLYSAAAWKTGVISYQKIPLKKILPELSDIYGIELICRDSMLREKIMDVGVPYMGWEATKESLELAMKVVIEKENGNYIIQNKE